MVQFLRGGANLGFDRFKHTVASLGKEPRFCPENSAESSGNEDQLNAMAAQNPGLSNRVQFSINNDKIIGKFTFPLDNLKQTQLKGRFLNGSFRLDILFLDATLSVFLVDVKANGKPLPHWAQNRLSQFNLVRDMYRQPDAVGFLQNLDALEVKDRVLRICPRDRSWLGY